MKSSWLRHLNPFHFETRILFWMMWANAVAALLLLPLILFLVLKVSPLTVHLTNLTNEAAEKFDRITDPNKLRQILETQIYNDNAVWKNATHLSESLAFLFAGLLFIQLINAFYLYKAHQLLKPK
jgi:hypothetical protein